jgi:signal-transduction protein with cAMP-binding, CBS, and nucleotidyltransferase domain
MPGNCAILPADGRGLQMSAFRRSKPEADQLSGFPLFSELSPAQVQKVAAAGQVVNLPANWAFISEGTPGDVFYVVLSGTVRVSSQGSQLADLEAGAVIGETGLLSGKLRNASVSTLTPSVLLHIGKDDFDRLMTEIPPLKAALEAAAAKHSK